VQSRAFVDGYLAFLNSQVIIDGRKGFLGRHDIEVILSWVVHGSCQTSRGWLAISSLHAAAASLVEQTPGDYPIPL
jgi:hypothetical protein